MRDGGTDAREPDVATGGGGWRPFHGSTRSTVKRCNRKRPGPRIRSEFRTRVLGIESNISNEVHATRAACAVCLLQVMRYVVFFDDYLFR